ncbi:MAG: 50S ribosomal protein L1 [Lentisphaerae bacterium]|nr:50S ribosomal protein L1 [Lentisphaerota bacterium]
MATHGKRYRKIREQAPAGVLELADAVAFVKRNATAKFDETVELGLRLGLDTTKSDNVVRGTVSLPHGTGRKVRVLVFASGPQAEEAKKAGADTVGGDELIEKVRGGWTEFDVAIATPEAMQEVRKLGRVLGPRGLMPNPKTGTVTDDVASAVRASKAGRVEFRMDKNGNVNVPCGKCSFEPASIAENVNMVVAAVLAEKPAGAKGQYIKAATLSSTMGVGVGLAVRE